MYRRGCIPCLVMPSYDKNLQLLGLENLWHLPWSWLDGEQELELLVIGYSVPPDDFHSRAFLYPRLVRGAREGRLEVKVIDRALDQSQREQVRARFEGVAGCRFYFDGFSPAALDFINEG